MAQLTWLTAGGSVAGRLAMNRPTACSQRWRPLRRATGQRLPSRHISLVRPWTADTLVVCPRTVIYPENLHISRSMHKLINGGENRHIDQDFLH